MVREPPGRPFVRPAAGPCWQTIPVVNAWPEPGGRAVLPPEEAVAARLRAAGCVFAEDEARLVLEASSTPADLEELVLRRCSGEPLEHVLGWAEFAGLRIAVGAGVFVPRQRSRLLVRLAAGLALARDNGPTHVKGCAHDAGLAPAVASAPVVGARVVGALVASAPEASGAVSGVPVVVDLFCGSGALGAAVAAALAAEGRGCELHAADIDPVAAEYARRNVAPWSGRVHVGDVFAALPDSLRGRIDVLVANAPYVPTGAVATMPPEARDHEPLAALDGGADGLALHRRVAAEARAWLAPGGSAMLEASAAQARMTAGLLAGVGLEARTEEDEELDAAAVVGTLTTSKGL